MILILYIIGLILSLLLCLYVCYKYNKEILVSDLVIGLLMSAIGSFVTLIVILCMEFITSKYWSKRIF